MRAALARGDYGRASDLVRNMQGHFTQSYLPLGDLVLHQSIGVGTSKNYRRELDLRGGIATTTFTVDGVHYRREVFASAPGEVIMMWLSADAPQKISLVATTHSPPRARCIRPMRYPHSPRRSWRQPRKELHSEKSTIGYTLRFEAEQGRRYVVERRVGPQAN